MDYQFNNAAVLEFQEWPRMAVNEEGKQNYIDIMSEEISYTLNQLNPNKNNSYNEIIA